MRGIVGDMFLCENKIYKIQYNHHPKKYFIAYPKYNVRKGKLIERIKDYKNLESNKFFRKINDSNIKLPLIPKSKIEEYYSSHKIGTLLEEDKKITFDYIKERLKQIGINKVGLTGYFLLKSLGYKKIDDRLGDLDLVITGKKNCLLLMNNKKKIYDKNFTSYKSRPIKIFKRRRKTMPYRIDYQTAKIFEAIKPIGIYKNYMHVNITPTIKSSKEIMDISSFKIKNLGLIKTRITLENAKDIYSVPGYYKIHGVYKNKNISLLRTTFFFYALCESDEKFEVCGNLLEENTEKTKRYVLSMENFGDYKRYYMNIA